ncbi:transposase [Mucispirillum schaedleri]
MQHCIIHIMRNSLKNVSYKAHKSITNDLKIYIIGKYSSSLCISL